MVLSTQTHKIFKVFGIDEGIKILAHAGFDAIDYSMFDLKEDGSAINTWDLDKYADMLLKCAGENGIYFNQAHAPSPYWAADRDDEGNRIMQSRIERGIRLAGMLGIKSIIVHPIAYPGGEENKKEFNLEMYRRLEPIALEYHTKIALENMFGYDGRRECIVPNVCSFGRDLVEYYEELNTPKAFTICLDIGHSGLVGEDADEAIRVIGHDRLGALHVHDNNYKSDIHTLPFMLGSSLNWENITRALGEIDYQGDFTFEADKFLTRFDRELLADAVNFMEKVGRHLADKVEKYRK